MGSAASLPNARPELWSTDDVKAQAEFFIKRDGYLDQIERKKVDGSKLSRLNPRLFKKLGFERIGWPSCGSVTGELRRIYRMYGEESDDSEAAEDEEVSETVLLKVDPQFTSPAVWTVDHVCSRLEAWGFGAHVKAFRHARVDGLLLLRMLKYDIECVGVRPKLAPGLLLEVLSACQGVPAEAVVQDELQPCADTFDVERLTESTALPAADASGGEADRSSDAGEGHVVCDAANSDREDTEDEEAGHPLSQVLEPESVIDLANVLLQCHVDGVQRSAAPQNDNEDGDFGVADQAEPATHERRVKRSKSRTDGITWHGTERYIHELMKDLQRGYSTLRLVAIPPPEDDGQRDRWQQADDEVEPEAVLLHERQYVEVEFWYESDTMGPYVLVETHTQLGNGKFKSCFTTMRGLIVTGESWKAAAQRAVCDDLLSGVGVPSCEWLSSFTRTGVECFERAETPLFPGLRTRYTVHSVRAIVRTVAEEYLDYWAALAFEGDGSQITATHRHGAPDFPGQRVNSNTLNADNGGQVPAEDRIAGPDNALHRSTHLWTWYSELQWEVICAKRAGMLGEQHMLKALQRRRGSGFQVELPLKWTVSRGVLNGYNSASVSIDHDGFGGTLALTSDDFGVGDVNARTQVVGELFDALTDVQCRCLLVNASGSVLLLGQGTSLMSGLNEDLQIAKLCSPEEAQTEIDGFGEMRSLLGHTCADLVAGPVLSNCASVAGVKYALEGACWLQPEFAGQHAPMLYTAADIFRWQVNFDELPLEAKLAAVEDPEATFMNVLQQVESSLLARGTLASAARMRASKREGLVIYHKCKEAIRLHLHANGEGDYVRDSAGDWVWRPDYNPHSLLLAEPLDEVAKTEFDLLERAVDHRARREPDWVQGWQPMFGKVHGALNADTIIVDHTETLWLVDFCKVHHGHIWSDVAHLETSFLFRYLIIPVCVDDINTLPRDELCAVLRISQGTATALEAWRSRPMPERQKRRKGQSKATPKLQVFTQKKWADQCEEVLSEARQNAKSAEHLQQIECDRENIKSNVVATEADSSAVLAEACRVVDRLAAVFDLSHPLDPNELDLDIPRVQRAWRAIVALRNCMPRLCAPAQPTARLIQPSHDLDRHPINLVMPCFVASLSMLAGFGLSRNQKRFALFAARRYAQRLTEWLAMPRLHAPHSEQFPVPPRLVYEVGHRVRIYHAAATEGPHKKRWIDGVVTKSPSDRSGAHTVRFTSLAKSSDPDAQDPWVEETHTADFHLDCTSHSTAAILRFEPGLRLWVQINGMMRAATILRGASNSNDHIVRLDRAVSDGSLPEHADVAFNMAVHNHSLDPSPPLRPQIINELSSAAEPPEAPKLGHQSSAASTDHGNESLVDNWATRASRRLHSGASPPLQGQECDRLARGIMFDVVAKDAAFGATVKIKAIEVHVIGQLPLTLYACEGGVERNRRNADEWKIVSATDRAKCEPRPGKNDWPCVKMVLDPPVVIEGGACVGFCVHCPAGVYGATQAIRYRAIPVKIDEDGLEEEIRPICEDDRVELLPGAIVERKKEELHDEGEDEERVVDQEALALTPQPFPEMFEAGNNDRPMMHFVEFLGTVEYEFSDEEDGNARATSVPQSLRTHDDAMFMRRAACGVTFMVESKRVGLSFESFVLRVGGVGLLPTVSVYAMAQERVQVDEACTASGEASDTLRINAVSTPQRWTLLTERRPVPLEPGEDASIAGHIAAAEQADSAVQKLANGDTVQKRDMTSQLVRLCFERKYVVPASHTVYFIVHSPDRHDAVFFRPGVADDQSFTVDQDDAACSLRSCAMYTSSLDVFDGELAEPASSADNDGALSESGEEDDVVSCDSIDGALDAQSLCPCAFEGAVEYDVAMWQPKFRKGQRLRLLCAGNSEEDSDNDDVADANVVENNSSSDGVRLQWRGASLIEMHETDPARGKICFEELSSEGPDTSNGQRKKKARQPIWWNFKPGNHVIEMIDSVHSAAAENRLQNNLRCRHTFVADVLTGHGLDTLEQCMNVRLPASVANAVQAEAQSKADYVAQQICDAEAAAARDAEKKALEDKVRASAAATGKATEVKQHDKHQDRTDEDGRKQRKALANEMQKSTAQAVSEAGTTGRVFAVIKRALADLSVEGHTSSGVLISGSAGAGKSMLLRRTLMHALKESSALGHVVPLLVSVADLSAKIEQEVADMRYLEQQRARAHRRGSDEDTDEDECVESESEDLLSRDASGQLGDLLDIWCQRTFGLSSPTYHFVKQAQLERRLLLMFDGVDEAGSQSAVVEKYIADEVSCQAALVVATITSQPDIEQLAWWARRFVHVSMAPLTSAQSRFVVAARLPAVARGPFLDFLKHTRHETAEMKVTNATDDDEGESRDRNGGDIIHPKEEAYGENASTDAIVSHPLMLSMMVSAVQGSAVPTMPDGSDCWAQRRVEMFHTMLCALLFRFRSRCAMLTTSGFFENLRSLVDKKSVLEKQLRAQGKGQKRRGRARLGSVRRPSVRSRMLIKERGQYGIQITDLLAFFRHVAFITHEHGRLCFDEALLEELLDADAHFRPVWKEVRRFAIEGGMNLVVWCPKKAGIKPPVRREDLEGVVEQWDGVDRGLFSFPHLDLQHYLASLEIMEQLSHTLRSKKQFEHELAEMQKQLADVERNIAEFEARAAAVDSSFEIELQKQNKAALVLKSSLDSFRTRVGIGNVNVEACDKQFTDGILHIKRLMLSKAGVDKLALHFPSRWWQPVLQFCCDHVTEWERKMRQRQQESAQHQSAPFMVADDARQSRYGSLATKNVAGGLEADDEKPSWRAALQHLTAEILPQADEVPSYWEDAAIVGRSIGSALHNIQGDAPSSDDDSDDTDDDDDGQNHWLEDPETAELEGVLRFNQLDALAISTLFRLLDFQPKANALVLTGLTHSGLVVASRTLASNTTLLSLTLNGNPMGPPGMHLLAAAMSSNTVLQRLLLRRTGACDHGDVEGLEALCKAVQVHPSLTALDLAECCIPPAGARVVALMLKGPVRDRMNGLRSLSLAHNPLVERDGIFAAGDLSGLQALLSTLVVGDAVQTLTALDLSHISLGSDGLALMRAALNQGCAGGNPPADVTLGSGNALSVLDLRGNGLGEKGAMALVETIVPLTSITALCGIPIERLRFCTLQSLQLRDTDIALCECVLIASFLREYPECLRVLDLSFNAIGVLGMRYIASAIEMQHSIRELLLAGTNIAGAAGGHAACSDAVVALAQALRKQKRASLRVLDLSDNIMCGAYSLVQPELIGLEQLMHAIKRYDKLRALNLANNNLGCSGLLPVAEMVAENHSLWSLNLSRNSLMNDAHDIHGFTALSNAIANNGVLTNLDLSWNRLTGTSYCVKLDGVHKFAASLQQNHALESLNFENNYVDLESEALLQRICDEQNIALRAKNRSELG